MISVEKRVNEEQIHETYYEQIFQTLAQEPYANHLGMKLKSLGKGKAEAELEVRSHMLNTHGTVHGAILFSLADYVFAAASNSYGKTAVGLTTTMNFMAPAKEGAILHASAVEEKRTFRLAWYKIKVECDGELLATMDATVYRKDQYFIPIHEMEGKYDLQQRNGNIVKG